MPSHRTHDSGTTHGDWLTQTTNVCALFPYCLMDPAHRSHRSLADIVIATGETTGAPVEDGSEEPGAFAIAPSRVRPSPPMDLRRTRVRVSSLSPPHLLADVADADAAGLVIPTFLRNSTVCACASRCVLQVRTTLSARRTSLCGRTPRSIWVSSKKNLGSRARRPPCNC